MNKKVTIALKPVHKEREKMLDSWVAGEKKQDKIVEQKKEKRFTIVIPEELYCSLRIRAAKEQKNLKALTTSIFQNYLKTNS